jgi:hypothetical protein
MHLFLKLLLVILKKMFNLYKFFFILYDCGLSLFTSL